MRAVLVLLVVLAACAVRTEPYRTAPQPVSDGYRSGPVGTTAYDNTDLAALFVQLTHGLESGAFRKSLQRFEAPVNVGFVGPGSTDHRPFLESLLAEIRTHTGIDIQAGPAPHNLLVQMIPGEEYLPNTSTQCEVITGHPTWEEFAADPSQFYRRAAQSTGPQTEMTVLIPDTIKPYQVRECLMEEITQALGPANDLYGLASTIFNDDNAHAWPTRLDYLMLRVLYDTRLHSGMDALETRTAALAVLTEINPQGNNAPRLPSIRQHQFKEWRRKLHGLHGAGAVVAIRQVRHAAQDSAERAPNTAYDCTGRTRLATLANDLETTDADALLEDALRVCARAHGSDDIRIADLRLSRAYRALAADRNTDAMKDFQQSLPIFLAHGIDDRIASAKIGLATVAKRNNAPNWVEGPLEDARQWSAYAFGDDHRLTRQLTR